MRGRAQLCSIFRVPIAIVSLVDTDRQWFKSIQGLPVSETSRKASFCAWTLLPACPTVLLVPDARLDERCGAAPAAPADVGRPRRRARRAAAGASAVAASCSSMCANGAGGLRRSTARRRPRGAAWLALRAASR